MVMMSKWIFEYTGYNIPKIQLRVPSATRPPSAPRPCHTRPTHQPSVAPGKERAPMTNSASEGLEKAPSRGRVCSLPGVAENRKKNEISARHRDKLGIYLRMSCFTYCSIAVARRGWVGRCVGRWLRRRVCGWASAFVRGYGWLTYFAVSFSGPMVLSPLDHGALRSTNWVHIYCCTLLLYTAVVHGG